MCFNRTMVPKFGQAEQQQNQLLTNAIFQKEELILFLKTHPSLLIIGINAIVVLVVLIRKCAVRRNLRSVSVYTVNEPQQETSFIRNVNDNLEDRYYDYSLGVSSMEMDFHYYDEVPVYCEADYCRTHV